RSSTSASTASPLCACSPGRNGPASRRCTTGSRCRTISPSTGSPSTGSPNTGSRSTVMAPKVGVAVVGFGWMGRVHTQAYARLPHPCPQLSVRPELVAVADEVPGRAAGAAARYGFATATEDWREIAADQRVHAVSITAPNFLHREIGVAMAQAGKHVWIEKPA